MPSSLRFSHKVRPSSPPLLSSDYLILFAFLDSLGATSGLFKTSCGSVCVCECVRALDSLTHSSGEAAPSFSALSWHVKWGSSGCQSWDLQGPADANTSWNESFPAWTWRAHRCSGTGTEDLLVGANGGGDWEVSASVWKKTLKGVFPPAERLWQKRKIGAGAKRARQVFKKR